MTIKGSSLLRVSIVSPPWKDFHLNWHSGAVCLADEINCDIFSQSLVWFGICRGQSSPFPIDLAGRR